MDEFKKNIKALVSRGNTKEALEELIHHYEGINEEVSHEIILISGNFNNIESNYIKGITDQDDYQRSINRINDSLLTLIDKKIPGIISGQVDKVQTNLKICRAHLSELIRLTQTYIKQFNIISLVIIITVFVIIFIPIEAKLLNEEVKNSIEFIKIGFGLFSLALPLWLQGLNYQRRNRIVSLQTSILILDNAKQVDDELLKKTLDNILDLVVKHL